MKKKFGKRLLVLLCVCALCVTSLFGGCGEREQDVTIEKGKTQVYVGIWDGGYGSNWCENWARKFEEIYKDEVFEEGKKGVQVVVTKSKNYAEDRYASNLTENSKDDIIFGEQANYYEFIRSNTVYDITEWVTTPLTEYNENKSITDKLSQLDKDYFSVGDDSKYYGVPWYAPMSPLTYDVDLFENSNFYFAAPGKGDTNGFVFNSETPRSKGPDGMTGTDDDGLPATYDEFFKLCDYMVQNGVTPFIWAGAVSEYVNLYTYALVADAEGYDDMKMNYELNGTATKLVKDINDGVITYEAPVDINEENGYLLKKHEGYYYALKFMNRLLTTTENGNKKYFDESKCFSESESHKAAQSNYLKSVNKESQIAMFIDGTWWYNEATEFFNQMSGQAGMGQYERKFGIMPCPKPDESYLGDATYLLNWSTSVVVRKNIDANKEKAIRAFYRYCHTDESLSSFLVDANGVRAFDFELKGVKESDMSNYALEQYRIMKKGNYVVPYDDNKVLQGYLSSLYGSTTMLSSYVGSNPSEYEPHNFVTTAFGSKNVSAENYFYGLNNYFSSKWSQFNR